MIIQFIKFYEKIRSDKKEILIGNLHIHLPEEGLSIKGIFVSKHKKHFYITPPAKRGYDKILKKDVDYPVITFMDEEKNKLFKKILIEEGKKYIENYLKENPELHNSPETPIIPLNPNVETTTKIVEKKPKVKIFVDPPKRKVK